MKNLENKQTSIALTEEIKAKYSDLIKIVIDQPLAEGLTLSEMAKELKLINKLDSAVEEIELTEDELKTVKTKVANFRWSGRHLELVEFGEYIASV